MVLGNGFFMIKQYILGCTFSSCTILLLAWCKLQEINTFSVLHLRLYQPRHSLCFSWKTKAMKTRCFKSCKEQILMKVLNSVNIWIILPHWKATKSRFYVLCHLLLTNLEILHLHHSIKFTYLTLTEKWFTLASYAWSFRYS